MILPSLRAGADMKLSLSEPGLRKLSIMLLGKIVLTCWVAPKRACT